MPTDLIYETAHWRLEEQLARVRELNARLMTVLSGATVLLVLFAALQDFGDLPVNPAALAFASASVGVYVALMLTSILGYRNPDLRMGFWPERVGGVQEENQQDRHEAAFALFESVETNAVAIRHKSQLVFTAVLLWAVDSLLLLATAITLAH